MTPGIKQAILLAAGHGTRLRPLTDSIPKCLVPINGKPLLHLWLEQLAAAGVERFLVNTHYLSDQVKRSIEGHPLCSSITVVHEEALKGTAGTVKHIWESGLCEQQDTLIAHADNLCFCNWSEFFRSHLNLATDNVGQMMSFVTDTPRQCGILETDKTGRLIGFHEKVENPPGNLANAAIYTFTPQGMERFRLLEQPNPDISLHLIPDLLGKMQVWENRQYMRDIGTPEAYAQAQKDALIYLTK